MRTDKKVFPDEVFKEINTRRNYHVYFSGSDKMPVAHSLLDIIRYSIILDFEWAHALNEDLDKLMDLGLMQSMFFFPNRDDAKNPYREHAIIKRIS